MMLGPAFIVGLLVFIIAAVIIIILVKKILKAVFLILALFLIIILFLGFFVYRDVVDLQKNFGTQNSLILMDLDDEIVAGVIGSFSGKEATPLGEVGDYNAKYMAGDYDGLLGQNYKIIVFEEEAFDNIGDVMIIGKEYSSEFIISLLRSDTPIDDYVDNEMRIQNLPEAEEKQARYELRRQIVYSNTEFKSVLFGTLLGKAMEDRGFIFILEQYREEDAVIYKETFTFKLIKTFPMSFVKGLVEKGKDKVQGMVVNMIGS